MDLVIQEQLKGCIQDPTCTSFSAVLPVMHAFITVTTILSMACPLVMKMWRLWLEVLRVHMI